MSFNKIKPKIVVSSCLGFEATRYNGAMLDNAFVRTLRKAEAVDFITVCPEVAIGLGVPRETLRVVIKNGEKHLIQPKTKRDVSENMINFTKKFTQDLFVDGFIFKADSPSVGTDHVKVYPSEKAFVGKRGGAGFFTTQIIKQFPNYPLESDRRLRNSYIQDSFLTKVYTLARFREEVQEKGFDNLEDFHLKNYNLLLAHNPHLTTELSKLIKESSLDKQFGETYFGYLLKILKDGSKREDLIICFEDMMKKLSNNLSKEEIKIYMRNLKAFKKNSLPKQAMFTLLEALATSSKNKDLMNQTLFNPFPLEFVLWEDPLQQRFLVNTYDLE